MPNIFEKIKVSNPGYNRFDLTHTVNTTTQMGKLIPILNLEVIPGDRLDIRNQTLIRLAPLVAPVMSRVRAYIHYFYVPYRTVWEGWDNFITGGPDGKNSYVIPNCKPGSFSLKGSLFDYMGIPLQIPNEEAINCLPLLAYQKIWFDYYRDQNVNQYGSFEDYITVAKQGGLISISGSNINTLHRRAWKHDYFTSALPWPQRGDAVTIPLDISNADVKLKAARGGFQTIEDSDRGPAEGTLHSSEMTGTGSPTGLSVDQGGPGTKPVWLNPNGTLYADNSNATIEGTIQDLRTANAIQRFLEKTARGGAKIKEVVKNFFGVDIPDGRIQLAEYLGGSSQAINIGEVLQTSETQNDGTPLGTMAGRGISAAASEATRRTFTEHGQVLGILSIIPEPIYHQGIARMYNRKTKLDFYWPEFANLGEQAILNKELYAYGDNNTRQATFGYIPRYSEYKYINSTVTGEFRDALKYRPWAFTRTFENQPLLNNTFIEAKPTREPFAITEGNEDDCIITVLNQVTALRKMPIYATPTL